MPVASKCPSTSPESERPVSLNRKISCIEMVGPSMPVTSARLSTLRRPSACRPTWMTILTADAICARAEDAETSMPLIPIICSTRASASRTVLAWTVVIEPS